MGFTLSVFKGQVLFTERMTQIDTAGRLLLFQKLVGAWVTSSILSAQSKMLRDLVMLGFCITRAAFLSKIQLLIHKTHSSALHELCFSKAERIACGKTCLFCLVGCIDRAFSPTFWYIYCVISLYAKQQKSAVNNIKAFCGTCLLCPFILWSHTIALWNEQNEI